MKGSEALVERARQAQYGDVPRELIGQLDARMAGVLRLAGAIPPEQHEELKNVLRETRDALAAARSAYRCAEMWSDQMHATVIYPPLNEDVIEAILSAAQVVPAEKVRQLVEAGDHLRSVTADLAEHEDDHVARELVEEFDAALSALRPYLGDDEQ